MSEKRPTKKDLEEKFHLDMNFEDAIKQMMNIPTELIFQIDELYPANEVIIGNNEGVDLRKFDFQVSMFFDDNPIALRKFALNKFMDDKGQKLGIAVHIPVPTDFTKVKIVFKNNSTEPINTNAWFISARDPGQDRTKQFKG